MILWSWIFFPRSKVFERSGRCPLSNGNVPRGRLLAICIFRARRVRDMYCSCAICFIRARFLFVRNLFSSCVIFILLAWSVFVRDLCAIHVLFCAPCAHDVFCRSRVRTPDHTARSFYWSQVRFRAWSPISGQWDPWPTSLAPTNGATCGTANKKISIER